MYMNAILFNLERRPSAKKPGISNCFMTFVDEDTGESFTTYVVDHLAFCFSKMKTVTLSVSVSVGSFNGTPQLNMRILSMVDRLVVTNQPSPPPIPQTVPESAQAPLKSVYGTK